jgi:hypothetical protein
VLDALALLLTSPSDRIDTLKVAGCDLGQDVEHSGLARGTRGTATATAPRRIVLGDEDEDEDEYITQPNEVSAACASFFRALHSASVSITLLDLSGNHLLSSLPSVLAATSAFDVCTNTSGAGEEAQSVPIDPDPYIYCPDPYIY